MNDMQANTANNSHQPQMQEKQLLNDLLNTEKQILTSQTTAIIEANCNELRSILFEQMRQVSQDQFNIFNEMNSRGYYPVKQAQPQDINTARQNAGELKGVMH